MSTRPARRLLAAFCLLGALALPAPWPAAVALGLIVWMGARRGLLSAARHLWTRRARVEPGAARLGRDAEGRVVGLSGLQLGAHALVVGASGAGKSTTLQTILADRIARGHPVVAIDMKGSPSFASTLADSARQAGRPLRVWTPEGPSHWNPLAHGAPTALKDRLISAERFSEPHYKRSAERFLQTALQLLDSLHPGVAPTLQELVTALDPGALGALARRAPAPLSGRVSAYLDGLTPDQLSAARGLATRLALLSESDAGRWLEPPEPGSLAPEVDLGHALSAGREVVLLSINSSIYGALGAQLGALAVQDLTSAAGRRLGAGDRPSPATVALDEFSALGADNVLPLLARGREAGVGVLLATQELADLERAGRGFRDQVLGITAVTLAHRQEVHESALAISRMAGTRQVWRETRPNPARARLWGGSRVPPHPGTRREHEEPIVHPNAIKRLGTGQLVLLTGIPRPTAARVQVDPPPSGSDAGRIARLTRRIRSAGRQDAQAAPGVTR